MLLSNSTNTAPPDNDVSTGGAVIRNTTRRAPRQPAGCLRRYQRRARPVRSAVSRSAAGQSPAPVSGSRTEGAAGLTRSGCPRGTPLDTATMAMEHQSFMGCRGVPPAPRHQTLSVTGQGWTAWTRAMLATRSGGFAAPRFGRQPSFLDTTEITSHWVFDEN